MLRSVCLGRIGGGIKVAGSPVHWLSVLPQVRTDPHKEFSGRHPAWRIRASVGARVTRHALRRVGDVNTLGLLGFSVASVFGMGCVEAMVQLVSPWSHLEVCVGYGLVNLVPSIVNMTVSLEAVVEGMGYGGVDGVVLDAHSVAGAQGVVVGKMLSASRAIVAGFVALSQVVRIVGGVTSSGRQYEKRVWGGEEVPLSDVKERVVRIGGKESDCTEVSLARGGEHFLAVFEDPHKVRHLVAARQAAVGALSPVFWRVPDGEYGLRHHWIGLDAGFSPVNLISTSTGRKLLIIEADATNPEEALALHARSRDLSFEDASQGMRQIHASALRGLRSQHPNANSSSSSKPTHHRAPLPFRSLRVFLGDTRQLFHTGGGEDITLRQRVDFSKEVDVVIDSRAPILLALLRWLGQLKVLLQRAQEEREEEEEEEGEEEGGGEGQGEEEEGDGGDEEKGEKVRRRKKKVSRKERLKALRKAAEAMRMGVAADGDVDAWSKPQEVLAMLSRWETVPDKEGDDGVEMEEEGDGEMWKVILDTGSEEYFAALSALVGAFGFQGVDASSVEDAEVAKTLPRLLYYSTSAATVNACAALARSNAVDPALTCALIDRADGLIELGHVDSLEEISTPTSQFKVHERDIWRGKGKREGNGEGGGKDDKKGGNGDDAKPSPYLRAQEKLRQIHVIASSVLYDDLFRQVRAWARAGHSPEEIQDTLDAQFEEILDISEGKRVKRLDKKEE